VLELAKLERQSNYVARELNERFETTQRGESERRRGKLCEFNVRLWFPEKHESAEIRGRKKSASN
jgi:hypothetical protein